MSFRQKEEKRSPADKGGNKVNIRNLKNANFAGIANSLPAGTSFCLIVDSSGNVSTGLIDTASKPVLKPESLLSNIRATNSMAKKLVKIHQEQDNALQVTRMLYSTFSLDSGVKEEEEKQEKQPLKKIEEINPRPQAQGELAATFKALTTLRENKRKLERLVVHTRLDGQVLAFLGSQITKISEYCKWRILYLVDRAQPDQKERDAKIDFGIIQSVFVRLTGTLDVNPGSSATRLIFPDNLSKNLRISFREFASKKVRAELHAFKSQFYEFYRWLLTDRTLYVRSLGREPTEAEEERLLSVTLPFIKQGVSHLYGTKQGLSLGKPGDAGYNHKLVLSSLFGYLTGVVPLGESPHMWNSEFLGKQFDSHFALGAQVKDFVSDKTRTDPDTVWPGFNRHPTRGEIKFTHQDEDGNDVVSVSKKDMRCALYGSVPEALPVEMKHLNFAAKLPQEPDEVAIETIGTIVSIHTSEEGIGGVTEAMLRSKEADAARLVISRKLLRQSDRDDREERPNIRIVDATQPLTKRMEAFFVSFRKSLPTDLRTSERVNEEINKAKQALMRLDRPIQEYAYNSMRATVQQSKLAKDFSQLYARDETPEEDDQDEEDDWA